MKPEIKARLEKVLLPSLELILKPLFKLLFCINCSLLLASCVPGKESIKYIQQYSDEHLIYEVFYNAKLSDANLRKSNQPFYEAVLDEIGNRNLSSIKQLEWIRMRSSLSNYQIGKTFEQLVELGGTPDKIDRNNDTILSVTYTDYFNFIDESNNGAVCFTDGV